MKRMYNTGAIGGYGPISGMPQQMPKSGIRNNMGMDYDENNNRKVNYSDLIRQYMSPGKQQYKAYSSAPTNTSGISKAQVNRMNMSHQEALAGRDRIAQGLQNQVDLLRPWEAQANDYMNKYRDLQNQQGIHGQEIEKYKQGYVDPKVLGEMKAFATYGLGAYAMKPFASYKGMDSLPEYRRQWDFGNSYSQSGAAQLKSVLAGDKSYFPGGRPSVDGGTPQGNVGIFNYYPKW